MSRATSKAPSSSLDLATLTSSSPRVAQPPPTPIEREYRITVYCTLAQINTTRTFTEEALDAYLREVLSLGYSDDKPGRLTIYPAHTIVKVEASTNV